MGQNRVRSKNAKKGFRWAKGQSSSSNPQKTRHRDQAKAKALQTLGLGGTLSAAAAVQSGPNKLTAESLLKHDALLRTHDVPMGEASEADAGSESGVSFGGTVKTFDTWASGLTQCTNVSFQKVIRKFNPNNPQHKEMLAILAAVTEVIKAKGDGEESSTEYLAALLTTLEVTEDESGLSAVMTLMALVIKTVPIEVLQAQFGTIAKVLVEHLAKYGAAADNPSVVRSLIGCLSVLLRAQSASNWSQNSTLQVYKSILTFSSHPKPKVRKAAHHAIAAILNGSYVMSVEEPPEFHPAAAKTAKDCLEKLSMTAEITNVLHTLILLKDVICVFPQSSVKSVCDRVLGLMQSKAHTHMTTCGMQMLYGLFNARSSETTLSAEMNAKLVTAINDYKPSVNDTHAIVGWLTVQQEALINLSFLDADLCLAHMPGFFAEAKKCWTSDKHAVAVAATTALKAVCNECIKSNIDSFITNEESLDKLQKCFNHVQDGFGYQYHTSWAQVLHLMAVVFDVAGNSCPDMVGAYLPALAEKRNADNFAFTNELDYVVGKAVRKMGPRRVLQHIPLLITGEESKYDFPRSWLLQVLRENVQNTELSFFITYFYPLAEKCRDKSNRCLNVDDKIGHNLFATLEHQMWSLLPGFCNNPTDLAASFKKLAKTLGEQLNVRKDLRMDVMSSLRQLILKNQDNDENKKVLSTFAKNYLPILYNIYTKVPSGAEETGQRLAAFETIKLYLDVAPAELRHIMFDNACIIYGKETGFIKESTLDILRAQLRYQDEPRIERLYTTAVSQLSSKDHREQKKAYKILEEICSSENGACTEYLSHNLETVQKVFLSALSKTSPSSQASRLLCLINIARKIGEDQMDFLFKVIPESVLCIKAVNEKARARSYMLLVVIGERLLGWDSEQGMVRYMQELLPSLRVESPTLINCTILAITRIFFEFRDSFPRTASEMLLHDICLLLTTQTREVVGSCLSFLRVFVQTNPVMETTVHIEQIIKSLINMTEDCKRYFRLKCRYLIDRIVRKFGYDFVSDLVPKDDVIMQKRLKNIKKMQVRKAKQDERQSRDEDSDEDDDDDFRVRARPKTMEEILADSDNDDDEMDASDGESGKKQQRKKKAKAPQTFISEKDDEGIVDFLDPSAAQRVTSVRPQSAAQKAKLQEKKQKEKNGGFKIATDGRLIIKDNSDDDSDSDDLARDRGKKDFMKLGMDSDEEDGGEQKANTFQALVSTNAARKRKMGGSIASSRRTAMSGTTQEPAMKYQAGGSGIHRAVRTQEREKTQKPENTFGSEYKATKARGDVKRKGKPDPYAYVPLNKSTLNKRKKSKYEGQFKNLVTAAKKGADTGSKSKGKAKNLAQKMKTMSM